MLGNNRGDIAGWVFLLLLALGLYAGGRYAYGRYKADVDAQELERLKVQVCQKEIQLQIMDSSIASLAAPRNIHTGCPYTPVVTVTPVVECSDRDRTAEEIDVLQKKIKEMESRGVRCKKSDDEIRKQVSETFQ